MSFSIRAEGPRDPDAIHALTRAAFEDAPHTSHTEQDIVDALRDSGALAVSLVAEQDGEVIGHVALSPVEVAGERDSGWYGLGPISVHPAHQRRGVGASLMHAALSALRQREAAGCVLLGDPAYYARFGFRPAAPLEYPGVPQEYFQAITLGGAPAAGRVRYHDAFGAVG